MFIGLIYYIGEKKLTTAYNNIFKSGVELTENVKHYHSNLIDQARKANK